MAPKKCAILVVALAPAVACTLVYPLDGYTRAAGVVADGGGPEGAASLGADPDPSPMLAYATTAGVVRLRRWNATAHTWSAPIDGPSISAGRTVHGLALKRSPVNGRRTLAVYTLPANKKGGELKVYDWAGDRFVEAFTGADFGAVTEWRPFDLACDGKTGQTLVVYGGAATGNPRLRVRDDKGWSPERGAFAAPSGKSPVHTELVTRPGTDDVALLYVDLDEDFLASRWTTNNVFEPATKVAGTVSITDHKAFAGAFEQKSGELLLMWSNDNTLRWLSVPRGAPAIPPEIDRQQLDTRTTAHVAMAADPSSDRVATAFLEAVCGRKECDDFTVDMWNGEAFDPFFIADEDITESYGDLEASAPIAVGWAGSKAVGVYYRESDGFRWSLWQDGKWNEQTHYIPRNPIGRKASFVPFRSGNDLVMLIEERSGTLWAKRFDGTSWSDTEGDAALATDLPSPADFGGVTFAVDAP